MPLLINQTLIRLTPSARCNDAADHHHSDPGGFPTNFLETICPTIYECRAKPLLNMYT